MMSFQTSSVCFTNSLSVLPSVRRSSAHVHKVGKSLPHQIHLRVGGRARSSKPLRQQNAPTCLEANPSDQPDKDLPKPPNVPEDLLSAFDAALDDLEKDLEESIAVKSDKKRLSSSETYRLKREIERQERLERKRLQHERRLQILTSLPAELVIEKATEKCPGCGATLQFESPDRPGYLPENLQPNSTDAADSVNAFRSDRVCQRCFRLTHYGDINPKLRVFTRNALTKVKNASGRKDQKTPTLPVSTDLTPGKFRRCLEQLQSFNAVVIYLVDIYDFHGTFIPKLRDIIGRKCPLILAVNKIDLLPKDFKVSRIEKWVLHECRSVGMRDVNSVHFISSYRNTGVSSLLADAVQLARRRRADIYVVGATNVGKSSFINQLICRHKTSSSKSEMYVPPIQHASESSETDSEPETKQEANEMSDDNGNEVPVDSAVELERSSSDAEISTDDETSRNSFANPTDIARPEKEDKKKIALTTSFIPGTTLDVVKIALGKGINLYDTPGLMVSHQLTNLLDEKDLRLVVPSKSVEKVTLRIGEKKALYIGGLARVEVAQGKPFFFTCFFSSAIKLHLGKAEDAEEFTKRHVGKMLTPPSTLEAYDRLGEWTSKTISMDGTGWKKSCTDIVLSGLGWIAITGAGPIQIRVWIPRDVGVFTREPLMPFELNSGVSTFTGTRAVNRKKKRSQQVDHREDFEF